MADQAEFEQLQRYSRKVNQRLKFMLRDSRNDNLSDLQKEFLESDLDRARVLLDLCIQRMARKS